MGTKHVIESRNGCIHINMPTFIGLACHMHKIKFRKQVNSFHTV